MPRQPSTFAASRRRLVTRVRTSYHANGQALMDVLAQQDVGDLSDVRIATLKVGARPTSQMLANDQVT
ncbi:MAG: hypothetical protein NTY19_50735 [Planctomycetota bacterium]|nr:hypothetical protein [Planctomycetota bacterium]